MSSSVAASEIRTLAEIATTQNLFSVNGRKLQKHISASWHVSATRVDAAH
ncbi:hypothetical protein NY78_2862 [Desulfovibrio sp. TomC]|nr:hypothetical protein NY78_2862 [Desulfovibrio sp. TomC]